MRTILGLLLAGSVCLGGGDDPFVLRAADGVQFADVSIDAASDGAIWAVWTEYDGEDDDVLAAYSRDGRWSEPVRVGDNAGADWQPAVACSDDGGIWVVWSSERWGDFGIRARVFSDGRWSTEGMVTRKRGSYDYAPSVDVAPDGTAWVAWESTRDGDTNIYCGFRQRGRWSPPVRLSPSAADDARPSLAVASDGTVWVAWDTLVGSEYRIAASRKLSRGWSDPVLVSPEGSSATHAALSAARDGSLVLAWEGRAPDGSLLPAAECVRVLRDGTWRRVKGAEAPQRGCRPKALLMSGGSLLVGLVDAGAGGRRGVLVSLSGSAANEVNLGDGGPKDVDGSLAMVPAPDGSALVGWIARGASVRLGRVAGSPAAPAALTDAPIYASPSMQAPADERPTIKSGLGRYTLYWGAFDGGPVSSGCDGIADRFRRARGVERLDFLVEAAGAAAMDEYDWTLARRTALIHTEEGSFVVLPGYSVASASGRTFGVVFGWYDPDLPLLRETTGEALGTRLAALTDKLHTALLVESETAGAGWSSLESYLRPCVGVDESSEDSVRSLLVRGEAVGFVGGSKGCLTAVYARRLTRAGVADALLRRRCYATNGARIFLDVRFDGHLMGEQWESSASSHRVQITADAPARIAKIELIGPDGVVVADRPLKRRVEKVFTVDASRAEAAYYYVRVRDEAGGVAWSSPVFVARPGTLAPAKESRPRRLLWSVEPARGGDIESEKPAEPEKPPRPPRRREYFETGSDIIDRRAGEGGTEPEGN